MPPLLEMLKLIAIYGTTVIQAFRVIHDILIEIAALREAGEPLSALFHKARLETELGAGGCPEKLRALQAEVRKANLSTGSTAA